MPTENFSNKIGSSPSPAIERVIQNNTNVQQPCGTVQDALNQAYNRHPVTDIGNKQK